MTNKTLEALALAEVALMDVFDYDNVKQALDAIREAKAELEKQEPVAVVEITYGREPECYVTGNIDDFPEGVFKLYAAPAQQAEQEPVALPFNCWSTNDGDSWHEHPADAQLIYDTLGDDAKVGDEFEVSAGWNCVTARYRIVSQDGDDFEVECISHPQDNATHVRTKDLTDAEIADVFRAIHMKESWSLDFARSVIAKFKEKNK